MSKSRHMCTLPYKDTSGLPRLPPNATKFQKCFREIRKLFLINPSHFKCKKLFRNKSSVLAERRRHSNSSYAYVIHPMSTINIIVEAAFVIVWSYTIIFDLALVFSDEFSKVFRFIQANIIPPFRLIIILLFFNVGYIEEREKRVVLEPRKIILRYLRTYFIFDAMASTYILQFMDYLSSKGFVKCSLSYMEESACFEVLSVARLFCCCARLYTLLKYMDETFANLNMSKLVRYFITYLVKTYLYLHIFSALLYFTSYAVDRGTWRKESWLAQAHVTHGKTAFYQYCQCLIMVICHFFGISYSYDVILINEQICIIFITLFGRMYTLYLLADILNIFGIVGVSESAYEKQLALLQQYMAAKDLPESLRIRMVKYYQFKFHKRYFKEADILNSLSEYLRTELFLFAARRLVQKVELFKKLSSVTLGTIIAAMKSETYSPKDVIVKLGSDIEEICFISTGTVALINKHGVEICHLEDGDQFGTNCLVSTGHQAYTVIAVEATEVFTILKNQLLEFLEPYPEVMGTFLKSVKTQLAKLKSIEDEIGEGKIDLLHNLRRGSVLEGRTKRLVAK